MRKAALFIVSVCLTAVAYGAPPSDASINTLLAVTRAEQAVDATFSNLEAVMRQSMSAAVQGDQLSAAQQRALDAAPTKFAKILREEMSWAAMRPLYVQIYRESFTQDEIDGLIAFYKSPAGIAFAQKMPLVMQKAATAMQSRMAPLLQKMNAVIEQAVDEAKASK